MTILEDLQLVETVLGDIGAFAAGQPVSAVRTIGADTFTVSVVLLAGGPTPQYQELSGSFITILFAVLADAAAVAGGAPLAIAIKENKSWYGLTLQIVPKAA